MPQAQIVHQFQKPDQLVLLAVPFVCANSLATQGSRALAETDMSGCCHPAAEPCEQLRSQTWRCRRQLSFWLLLWLWLPSLRLTRQDENAAVTLLRKLLQSASSLLVLHSALFCYGHCMSTHGYQSGIPSWLCMENQGCQPAFISISAILHWQLHRLPLHLHLHLSHTAAALLFNNRMARNDILTNDVLNGHAHMGRFDHGRATFWLVGCFDSRGRLDQ